MKLASIEAWGLGEHTMWNGSPILVVDGKSMNSLSASSRPLRVIINHISSLIWRNDLLKSVYFPDKLHSISSGPGLLSMQIREECSNRRSTPES